MSEPAGDHGHSSDESHSHRGHRRRRRHKREKQTSRAAIGVFVALILIVGAGFYFTVGPRVIRKLKSAKPGQRAETSGGVVRLTYFSVIITNSTSKDWGYTTVTVNDQYSAHCPDIPKGTQFEIQLKNFRGPEGPFEPTAPTVRRVTVQVDGQAPIVWDRPLQ